jgi:sulfide:quinone oxidoreductase
MELKKINDQVSVSPQIAIEDLTAIRQAGFEIIINNRPDGESPDQPLAQDVKKAAIELGFEYYDIPMGRDGVSPDMILQTQAVLNTGKKILAFCRSGTRSTTLWALSQAGNAPAEEIIGAAAHAGSDISHLAGYLNQ